MEREQHQTEIRDLQDQLSEMHDELDSAKRSEDREKGALIEVRGAVGSGDERPHLPGEDGMGGGGGETGYDEPYSVMCICSTVPMARFHKNIM